MPPKFDNAGWHIFGYILLWSFTFINPIIYIFANQFFRLAFLKTFTKNSTTNNPTINMLGTKKFKMDMDSQESGELL